MSTRSMAESVILQAIEDMCADESARGDCLEYFLGGDFSSWARLAGMSREDQRELMELLQLPTKPIKLKKTRIRQLTSSRFLSTTSACV